MWTIANLVDRFCDRYDFFIVTRNYDSKGDTKPYTSVKTGEWNKVGNASVYYIASRDITKTICAHLTNLVTPDVVFLNSVLSTPVIKFLMARQKTVAAGVPVIVAPCGELSRGALKEKSLKKKAFLTYAKATGLFDNVIWKASSKLEVDEIVEIFGAGTETLVAPDLAPKTILPDFQIETKPEKQAGMAKFIFLSRLVRKKNLKFFLEHLQSIKKGTLDLEIVGPLEDAAYWRECKKVIAMLPPNVKVRVVGAVSYPDGLKLLCSSHFFVLPTYNENFGYVLLESLAAGTPLLTTDQISWEEIEHENAGWQIPLDAHEEWIRRIEQCIQMENDEFLSMSASARKYAVEWLAKPEFDEAMAKVLARALNDHARNVGHG